MPDPSQMDADIDKALRGGNPDDAARVIMSYKNCSLTDARKEVSAILAKRSKR